MSITVGGVTRSNSSARGSSIVNRRQGGGGSGGGSNNAPVVRNAVTGETLYPVPASFQGQNASYPQYSTSAYVPVGASNVPLQQGGGLRYSSSPGGGGSSSRPNTLGGSSAASTDLALARAGITPVSEQSSETRYAVAREMVRQDYAAPYQPIRRAGSFLGEASLLASRASSFAAPSQASRNFNRAVSPATTPVFNLYAGYYEDVASKGRSINPSKYNPLTVVGNLGSSYYSQRAQNPSAVVTDVAAFELGGATGGRVVKGGLQSLGAIALRRGPGATRALSYVTTGTVVGLGLVGAYSGGKEAINNPTALTSQQSVAIAGFVGGSLSAGTSSAGLRQVDLKLPKELGFKDYVGSNRGGLADAPAGNVEFSATRTGTVDYTYFGNKLPTQKVEQFAAFKLLKTESGDFTGRFYTDLETTNPLTKKTVYKASVYDTVGRGGLLAGREVGGDRGFVVKQLSSKVLGRTDFGEVVSLTTGRTSYLDFAGGKARVTGSSRRASVSSDLGFTSSRKVDSFGEVNVVKYLTKGQQASYGEGIAGSYKGSARRSYVPAGLRLLIEKDLYSPPVNRGTRGPLYRNRAGSLGQTAETELITGRLSRPGRTSTRTLEVFQVPKVGIGRTASPISPVLLPAGLSVSRSRLTGPSKISYSSSKRSTGRSSSPFALYAPRSIQITQTAPAYKSAQVTRQSTTYKTADALFVRPRTSSSSRGGFRLFDLPVETPLPLPTGRLGYKPSGGYDANRSLKPSRSKANFSYSRGVTANFFNIKNKASLKKLFTGLEVRG